MSFRCKLCGNKKRDDDMYRVNICKCCVRRTKKRAQRLVVKSRGVKAAPQ